MAEDPDELTRIFQKIELLAQSGGGLLINNEEVKLLMGAIKAQNPPEEVRRFKFQQTELLHKASVIAQAWRSSVSETSFVDEHREIEEPTAQVELAMSSVMAAITRQDFKPGEAGE